MHYAPFILYNHEIAQNLTAPGPLAPSLGDRDKLAPNPREIQINCLAFSALGLNFPHPDNQNPRKLNQTPQIQFGPLPNSNFPRSRARSRRNMAADPRANRQNFAKFAASLIHVRALVPAALPTRYRSTIPGRDFARARIIAKDSARNERPDIFPRPRGR